MGKTGDGYRFGPDSNPMMIKNHIKTGSLLATIAISPGSAAIARAQNRPHISII